MKPCATFSLSAFQDAFNRRLQNGYWLYTPCLDWKEFTLDYVLPFRPGTRACGTGNHVIPVCLKRVLNQTQNGEQIR